MIKKLKLKKDDAQMIIVPRLFEIIKKINELIDQREQDKINRDIDLTTLRIEITEIKQQLKKRRKK